MKSQGGPKLIVYFKIRNVIVTYEKLSYQSRSHRRIQSTILMYVFMEPSNRVNHTFYFIMNTSIILFRQSFKVIYQAGILYPQFHKYHFYRVIGTRNLIFQGISRCLKSFCVFYLMTPWSGEGIICQVSATRQNRRKISLFNIVKYIFVIVYIGYKLCYINEHQGKVKQSYPNHNIITIVYR